MIRKIIYEVTMTTKEPFRIGGKEDPLRGQENPVAIVGNKVVVPGSSLKGALRSAIERYLIDLFYDKERQSWGNGKEELKPCIPTAKQLSKDEEELIRSGKYRKTGCHYPCDQKPNKCGSEKHSICPACYLLGANGLNGFLRIPFLCADTEACISELYSARLDRATKTVTQGTNRPYSLVPSDIILRGQLEVMTEDDILNWILGKRRNLGERSGGDAWLQQDNWNQDRIIQDLIIGRLQNIDILGGYKSKGCGKVHFKLTEVPIV